MQYRVLNYHPNVYLSEFNSWLWFFFFSSRFSNHSSGWYFIYWPWTNMKPFQTDGKAFSNRLTISSAGVRAWNIKQIRNELCFPLNSNVHSPSTPKNVPSVPEGILVFLTPPRQLKLAKSPAVGHGLNEECSSDATRSYKIGTYGKW